VFALGALGTTVFLFVSAAPPRRLTLAAPLLAGLAVVALLALLALGPLRRRVRAGLARRGASGAAGVGEHAAAANDSRQDLAA